MDHSLSNNPSSSMAKPEENGSKGKKRSRLRTVFQFGAVFLVVIFIIGIVVYLVHGPWKMEVYVESASLTQFDLAGNNTLYYNLTLDISVRNPYKRISIDYDRVAAGAFYDGIRFGYVELPSFSQDQKSTVMLNPAFRGQSLMGGGDSAGVKFKREKGEGHFYIDAKIYFRVKYQASFARTQRYDPAVDCPLSVSVATPANTSNGFTRTQCGVVLP